jgi:TolB protein
VTPIGQVGTWTVCAALAMTASATIAVALAGCGGDDNDPGLIVYEASEERATNVYTIDPESHETVQVTEGTSYDGQPAWSPDGNRIIFISDREQPGKTDIFTMAPDGSDVQRLTATTEVAERSPKYAPDGSRIAVALDKDREYYLATLAPDGTDEDILSVNVETKAVTVRVSTPSPDVCPHFSYDEKYMTYARSPGGADEEQDVFRREVTSDDVSGASDERLTDDEARDDYANPSPDDERYVFLSNRGGNFDLYLMDRDGGNVTRITDTPGYENVPDW